MLQLFPSETPVIKTSDAKKATMSPACTGTSVIGIKYKDGVILAADVLISYGSLARYMDFERILKVNNSTVIACSGDIADYQFVKHHIKEQTHTDELLNDGFQLSWITRVLYNRRSQFEPLWNNYVVGGIEPDGEVYLGYCNMIGVSFTEDCVATGFGSFLAIPLLRRRMDDIAGGNPNNLSEEDAILAITDAMRQLFYRDCRAFDSYQLAIVRKTGLEMRGPLRLKSDWQVAEYVQGYE